MSNNIVNESINSPGTAIKRGTLHLAIGNIYSHKDTEIQYEMIEIIDLNIGLFKNLSTLINELISVHSLENVTKSNNVFINIDAESISDSDWKKAQHKHLIIEPLLCLNKDGNLLEKVENRAKEYNVSGRTIRRWIDAYKSTGSIASLLEKKRGWDKEKVRLDYATDTLIKKVINDFYLTPQRPTVQATIRRVHKLCYEKECEKPSGKSIRYRINQLPESVVLKKRGQRERAKNKFTPKTGSFPEVLNPLDVVQIDHTPADIILVDDKYRKPIGRPWITVAIDIYSRVITGFYISLDPPSVTSVGICMARSILPKDNLLIQNGITDADWKVYGYPRKIHVDNGSDFRSEDLRKSCALHGINIEFRPLARPEYGGHVERVIGNLMKKVHELPGTTFSNIKQKEDYDAEKNASLTLAEFEKWFLTYIVKEYHHKIHSGIQKTPTRQWEIGIFGDKFRDGIGIPPLPIDETTLKLDFLPSFERTIQSSGVRIDGLHYYDACINLHVNTSNSKGKNKFIFRRDPRDISKIWFFDPVIKKYFVLPFANQNLPSMSLWEYQQIKKQVKSESGSSNDHLIYQAWDEMQTLAETAESTTKTQRRKEQRRKSHAKSQKRYENNNAEKDIIDSKLADTTCKTAYKNIQSNNNDDNNHGELFFEDIE
jgi:putative transposase